MLVVDGSAIAATRPMIRDDDEQVDQREAGLAAERP
jgi:hypothetical protein